MHRLTLPRRASRAPWASPPASVPPSREALAKRFFAAGAQINRLTSDWIRSASTPDLEVRADLRVLRRRARELVRDNAYARRFTRILRKNVIGPNGIRPVPCNPGADGKLAKKANQAIMDAWQEWSMPENASADALHSWTELEGLILATVATDGECFIRLLSGYDNAFGFAVELLDADLLDEQFNREASPGRNEIRMGIERDARRRPLAYHFWKYYPNAPSPALNEKVPIPADEIVHLFTPLRVGQSRGISWYAPVLLPMKMLDGYQEAELVAARTAAAKMGFFTTPHADDGTQLPPNTGEGERLVMEASAGMAEQLPPGVEFQPWDPQHPTQAFATFVEAILRSQAAGLDTSYMSLSGDLSQTSFSSGRIGINDERDGYEILQTWLATHCHRRVFRRWLPMAMLAPEQLSLPSVDARRWLECDWHPRDWDYIDPTKDVAAIESAIGIGIESRTHVLRSKGRNYEDVIAELGEENTLAEAAGVDITGAKVTVKETAPTDNVENADNGVPAATAVPGKPTASAKARALRGVA